MKDEPLVYKISNTEICISNCKNKFKLGQSEYLSNNQTDVCSKLSWYNDGYKVYDFLSMNDFKALRAIIENTLQEIIYEELGRKIEGFKLENYHNYVNNDEDHYKVVNRTRSLVESKNHTSVQRYIKIIEGLTGLTLSNKIPHINQEAHFIIRINRPNSNDYNPPHKDIYEVTDNFNTTLKMLNCWIPIAGVNEKSSLPIVPQSHLLNEDEILRAFEGANIGGRNYRVRIIKSWDNQSQLFRADVKESQILIFSSYLIHGLATNFNNNITRVALELRLFER